MAHAHVSKARAIVLSGLVFGVAMCLFIGWTTGSPSYGFHGGFLSAFAFGALIGLFLKKTTRTLEAEMENGEEVLFAGPANHQKGIEAVGGRLSLTASRLRFRSHA